MTAGRFPENSRVCFIGDSITCNNSHLSRIVDFYNKEFPNGNINFYNCGVSGANSHDMLALFDIETMTYKPTHAVVMFGVNDSGRSELVNGRSEALYNDLYRRFEVFQANFDKICRKLRENNVEITLATPIPLDEYGTSDTPPLHGSFALMSAYAEFVRAYAKEHGYPLVDQYSAFTKLLACEEAVYESDRVHPNDYGQYHLAKNILEAQGFKAPEYAPIPEYLDVWREKTKCYRYYILTVECLLLGRYDMPLDEALKIINEKLKTEENPFVLDIGAEYVKYKPVAEKLKAEMIHEMEVGMKRSLI